MQRRALLIVAVAGLLVPTSYVVGFARADAEALWGGIDGALRAATMPFMFLAAAGFLAAAYILFFRWDEDTFASMQWPGRAPDGRGAPRVIAAYMVYLIPSMLWLEATILHLRVGAAWTQALVIAVLSLVSVGLLMLGALAYDAVQRGVPAARALLGAVVAMSIQSIINDNIIWVALFPW